MSLSSSAASVAASPTRSRPRVLCVDDEPYVLDGLRDNLRRSFDVETAESGAAGLELLKRDPQAYEIVISDMRMPVMSGSVFLAEARRIAPNTVRILLTGYADTKAAVRAVNDGQIFRFLTKPCDVDELLRACAAALMHRRVQSTERLLLEQTLRGSIQALTDVLALANPSVFGQANRVKGLASRLARKLGIEDAWEIEVAAMLSHVGAVTLPAETAERLRAGDPLTDEEQAMVDRLPEVTAGILGNIPRLEGVLQILANYTRRMDSVETEGTLPIGARIVRVAVDADRFTARGGDHGAALEALIASRGVYDHEVLKALAAIIAEARRGGRMRQVRLPQLEVGMILADDMITTAGQMLVPRGFTVTPGLIERLRNFRPGVVREPFKILADDEDAPWGAVAA
jgi:response regulator RpfG family c-di-GMP phosphodiesterase